MKFYYKEEQTKQIFRIFPPLLPIYYNIHIYGQMLPRDKKISKKVQF